MKRTLVLTIILALALASLVVPGANAQNNTAPTGSTVPGLSTGQTAPAESSLPGALQAGLLPAYGVDFRFDPASVPDASFPGQSADFPKFGVRAAFQNVWEGLKPGGFNTLRVPIDVRDSNRAANRLANLCVWAQNNNVKLLPILVGAESGQPLDAGYTGEVTALIRGTITALRSAGQNLPDYTQILAYQLEDAFNHAGLHGAMSLDVMQARLLEAAGALRQAEQGALQGTGMGATPVMVDASFDYELIQTHAIAGLALSDDAYNTAYAALKQRLAAFASSANIDMIGVDWFAGSVSAGGVEKFPALLKRLEADIAGKQLLFTTGFSVGFHTVDERRAFYAAAIKSLADHRAQEGTDGPFVGLFFHEALPEPDPAPPTAGLAAEMPQWDWTAKAVELARLWNGLATSESMAWWWKKVENNMGLLAAVPGDAQTPVLPVPAAQDNTNPAAASSAPNSTPLSGSQTAGTGVPSLPANSPNIPGSGTGSNSFLKDKLQQGLGTLLDSVFARLASLISGNTGGGIGNTSGGFASSPGVPTIPEVAISGVSQGSSPFSGQGNSPAGGSVTNSTASSGTASNNTTSNGSVSSSTASNTRGISGSSVTRKPDPAPVRTQSTPNTTQGVRSAAQDPTLVRTQSAPPASRAASAMPRSQVRPLTAKSDNSAPMPAASGKPVTRTNKPATQTKAPKAIQKSRPVKDTAAKNN